MDSVSADTAKHSAAACGARPFPPIARRVLVIGLDGATFDILNPLMAEGRMPRMAEAVAGGASGILRSTIPPITPAAWTTFLTGKQPGTHGIIDFERYDVRTNRLSLNSTRCLDHVRTLWNIVGDQGLKVGSVNVPMTFPAVSVNGFLVSGFETPGPDSDFVYPAQLKDEILRRWPDPTLRAKWRRRPLGGESLFQENLAYISRSFQQGADMTIWLGDKYGWDVLMVVLKLVDNLQHKTWKYLDPRWAGRNPRRNEAAKRCFEDVDQAVGVLIDYATRHEATVLIVSDHGHGSLEGKIQPNLLLKRWGYLRLRGGAQGLARTRSVLSRSLGRKRTHARVSDIERDLAVDFAKTTACVMHAGMAGFLYINLEGRQPTGIVKPAEYETLRNELKQRFLGPECRAVDPQGNTFQLFEDVQAPEVLYGCSRKDQPWLPDLILTPHASLAVIRKIRGSKALRWLPYRKVEGTHRPEGIFVATGAGITRNKEVRADIVDCAQTILAMLGLRVPEDMEGRVLTEIFDRAPIVETEVAVPSENTSAGDEVYSEADLQQITERLADLGYLE